MSATGRNSSANRLGWRNRSEDICKGSSSAHKSTTGLRRVAVPTCDVSTALYDAELMKTVFLHVGTHTTATTTLQRFLFLNREKLGSRGIFLPLDAECATRHGSFAHALKGKSALSAQPFLQLKLDLQARQPHTAILTSESFAPQLSRTRNEGLRYRTQSRATCQCLGLTKGRRSRSASW